MQAVFAEEATVASWLAAEAALAGAQADVGLLPRADADAIAAAAVLSNVDIERLWAESYNVGYPILPLVRMLSAALPEGPAGRVHYGATTQDIMDTGLTLQLVGALEVLSDRVQFLGDALSVRVNEQADTVMAARTHNQQAVPTTFGAKLAVYLGELDRHRERLVQLLPRLAMVSLYGAGGTGAALGPSVAEIRQCMADRLGLSAEGVPWHVARDGVAEFGSLCALLSATAARLAREVIGLSRSEVREACEPAGHHRGASSTMPQKANPITSEAIIGLSGSAAALSSALYRAMGAEHERAAGEWQVEWQVVPQLAVLAASSLRLATELAEGIAVDAARMRANMHDDITAEGYMITLAEHLGREAAHDLVYLAVRERSPGTSLRDEVCARLAGDGISPQSVQAAAAALSAISADSYLGEAQDICKRAVHRWANGAPPSPLPRARPQLAPAHV